MKRIFSVAIILIFIFLVGCGKTEKTKIEGYDWTLSHITNNETGEVLFCSADTEIIYGATVADLSFTTTDSTVTVKNNNTSEEWNLEYTEHETLGVDSEDGSVYNIIYNSDDGSLTGYANTGISYKSDEYNNYYFVITLGGHTIYLEEHNGSTISE